MSAYAGPLGPGGADAISPNKQITDRDTTYFTERALADTAQEDEVEEVNIAVKVYGLPVQSRGCKPCIRGWSN